MDRSIGSIRPVQYRGQQLFRASWALLIGVNASKAPIPSLRFAEADAKALAQLLPEIGIPSANIRTLFGPAVSREAIYKLLNEMGAAMDIDDRLIAHFAGHGVPIEGAAQRKSGSLLLPQSEVGGPWPTPASPYLHTPPSESYSMDSLFADIDQLPPKHKLILLDTCLSGFLKTRAYSPMHKAPTPASNSGRIPSPRSSPPAATTSKPSKTPNTAMASSPGPSCKASVATPPASPTSSSPSTPLPASSATERRTPADPAP